MKPLHIVSFCSHTAAWLVLVWLSPALLAEPTGDSANQLRDALERQGWEMQRAPDGSLIYYPAPTTARKRGSAESLRQALERQGWRLEKGADGNLIYWPPTARITIARQPSAVKPGPVDESGEARVQVPQTKPASVVREEAPALVEEPGTAALTEAPDARPAEDTVVEPLVDNKTPTRTSEAGSRQPGPEQRLRTPRWSGYYGHPLYRPLPPVRYRPPPMGYRRAGPPCPYGPWGCR